MTIDYQTELLQLKQDAEAVHALLIRIAAQVAGIREHLDELTTAQATRQIICEHHVPLGDYCEHCSREVRRAHCSIHDTDVIGACPYCAETHRLDTPEG